jgi:Flp pilus assembly protein TadB
VRHEPRGWTASVVSFAFTVLAVCLALKLAAEWLLDALPVLLPALVVVLIAVVVWRWWSGRSRGW